MKILVINCSPVKNGATAQIVNMVSEFCGKGNEVRAVCIDDYEIKLCRGCRKCHESAECSILDDTKGNLGFRRFHLRGKEKVGIEWGLLMLGYDFKQLIRLMNT